MTLLPIDQKTMYISNSKNKEYISLSIPHMTGKEKKYINEAFDTNWIAPIGPNVNRFEQELAEYVGVQSGAALSSGTAAIHLSLQLLGIGKGDLVFCSSLTFAASANPIFYVGAEPVFIDSEDETWNMSPTALRKAFEQVAEKGKIPKAVIVVNLYGQSAKMDELLAICNEYEVPIIEDAAESLGSTYKGKKSGTLGKFGVFSFNGNKIITTSGGGMLVSDDVKAIEYTRFLASQAKDPAPYYQHSKIGFNYRMSNILAGIGRAQLEVLEDRVAARRSVYRKYEEGLSGIDAIKFQPELEGTYSNRWLSVLTIDPRLSSLTPSDIMSALSTENIETRHVWKPLHQQPIFKDCLFFSAEDEKPISDVLFEQGLCLPSSSSLSEVHQNRVINSLKKLFS
ncbi:aminotransferase class I/II-fold pyridoxal phosphate-dependent enzyme [Planomicrobium sp. CPCC 101110]|uniref:aminotransferase class I/II-fold pyridoxal phosphate-dependent enzyme n=1 Tax=Planomicrobium sp. CPCC 101110 TaxID=2599619 RepID=UPI00272BD0F7|nr:aminotransferase class I/II-fold pyridoxal phosphate-dependent enzyme [Planomicrobium sp. CPCC 101110]